ncbi:MAG: hypothetical protein AAFR84_15510 [Pseudomonadota bacterium]
MKARAIGATTAFVTLLLSAAQAQEITFGGELSATTRIFVQDGLYDGQDDAGVSPILSGRVELSSALAGGRAVLEAFGQWDPRTDSTRIDLPRAFYQRSFDGFDVLVGSNTEFWGVNEGARPVDVINQEDILDAPNRRDRLGQPMINVNIDIGSRDTLGLWGLGGFRERDFGDETARFRAPFLTNESDAQFEEGLGRHFDFAARYASSRRLGNSAIDFAVSYFNGTDRNPSQVLTCLRPGGLVSEELCDEINAGSGDPFDAASPQIDRDDLFDEIDSIVTNDLVASASEQDNVVFIPNYQHIQQFGGELTLTTGSFQFNAEGAVRIATGETSFSGAAGAQYTFSDLFDTDAQLLLIGEYLYDNRSTLQPLNFFEDDVFLGFNYSQNDVAGTQLTGGLYIDTDSAAQIYSLTFGRRLTDTLKLNVSVLFFNTDGFNDPLSFVENDSYLEVSLAWFF